MTPDNHTVLDKLISGSNATQTEVDRNKYCHIHKDFFFLNLALLSSFVVVTMGIAGNLINIVVMSRYLQKHSSNVYIFCLAISDSVYLISTLLCEILPAVNCYYYYFSNFQFCQLILHLIEISSDYSSMIILCFTIERCIAVYKPIKVKIMCSLNKAKILCFLLLLVVSISTVPPKLLMIYTSDVVKDTFEVLLVEITVFRIVPAILIIILNSLIIYQMVKKKRVKCHKKDTSKKITIILILISTSYMALQVPPLIHVILTGLRWMEIVTLSDYAFDLSYRYSSALYACSYAINFYLYSIGSKLFRQQLKETYDSIRSRMSFRT